MFENKTNVVAEGFEWVLERLKSIGHYNVIGSCVEFGDDVQIGNHCIIGDGVKIGRGTKIMSHVELREGTVIGDDCYIDSDVKCSGNCEIGDRVTLRYGAIIARGCKIRDDAYICPRVMTNNLDHNRVQVGGALVGSRCFIGTHTVLAAGIVICADTVVGSQSFVTKTIDIPGVYFGIPATLRK